MQQTGKYCSCKVKLWSLEYCKESKIRELDINKLPLWWLTFRSWISSWNCRKFAASNSFWCYYWEHYNNKVRTCWRNVSVPCIMFWAAGSLVSLLCWSFTKPAAGFRVIDSEQNSEEWQSKSKQRFKVSCSKTI